MKLWCLVRRCAVRIRRPRDPRERISQADALRKFRHPNPIPWSPSPTVIVAPTPSPSPSVLFPSTEASCETDRLCKQLIDLGVNGWLAEAATG